MKIENGVLLEVSNDDITDGQLVIPKGVTSIGEGACRKLENLTSIDIPEGVTAIGEEAFYDCNNLTSVYIPCSVTGIGNHAFSGCANSCVFHIGANTEEDYNRIYSLQSIDEQETMASHHQEFKMKAIQFMAAYNHDTGFFKENPVPIEIILRQLFMLAKVYGVPSFTLNKTNLNCSLDMEIPSNMEIKPDFRI